MPFSNMENTVGGDIEPPILLRDLALRNPEHEFRIVGRNTCETPEEAGLPSNVTNPWTALMPEYKQAIRTHGGFDRLHTPLRDDERRWVCSYLPDLTWQLFHDLDAIIIWAGQHGTSNYPIPQIGESWEGKVTKPQDAFLHYCSYLAININRWRDLTDGTREEIWLHSDARNYLKARDLKWPQHLPMLGQFAFERDDKYERYGDTRSPQECGFPAGRWEGDHVWIAPQKYEYSRLELCSTDPARLPDGVLDNWTERTHFGIFINEARAYVRLNRKDIVRDWVLPLRPTWMHGKWSAASLAELGLEITTIPTSQFFAKYATAKCTLTTPSSGSGWATTKPWEAFASGSVCFFHPEYDTQGWIIPTIRQVESGLVQSETLASLARWLRVSSADQLARRVHLISNDEDLWRSLATAQYRYYRWAWDQFHVHKLIEGRWNQ